MRRLIERWVRRIVREEEEARNAKAVDETLRALKTHSDKGLGLVDRPRRRV